jgi:hypothetical protein
VSTPSDTQTVRYALLRVRVSGWSLCNKEPTESSVCGCLVTEFRRKISEALIGKPAAFCVLPSGLVLLLNLG